MNDEQGDHHKQLTGWEVYFTRDELRVLLVLVENSKAGKSRDQQDRFNRLAERIREIISNDAS